LKKYLVVSDQDVFIPRLLGWDVRTKPSIKAKPVAETQRRLPLKFSFLSITCIFFLAISSCQERLSRSKIASDMIGFQPGFFTLTHHSYFVTSGCSVNAARQREEFLPIA